MLRILYVAKQAMCGCDAGQSSTYSSRMVMEEGGKQRLFVDPSKAWRKLLLVQVRHG